MSWSVDTDGHVFHDHREAAEKDCPHVVVDRAGIEWTVREVPTPQSWARRSHCLVLSSRECVRRLWDYPKSWRNLDAEALFRLGLAD